MDLALMLRQVASEFEPQFTEKGLTCTLSLPDRLEYDCDPDKLSRVFDNLLRNAFHYSFPDTAVNISARREEGEIILAFSNEGRDHPSGRSWDVSSSSSSAWTAPAPPGREARALAWP